jgi:hypothetical protein
MRILGLVTGIFLFAACSSDDPTFPVDEDLTAAVCLAHGGVLIGDGGDGTVLRPDYLCPNSGVAPFGKIVPVEGEPTGVEGAVCCEK